LSSCGQRYASSYRDFIVSIFTESIGWQQEDETPVVETVWPVGGNLRRNRALRATGIQAVASVRRNMIAADIANGQQAASPPTALPEI
jgi:hypothetical protein